MGKRQKLMELKTSTQVLLKNIKLVQYESSFHLIHKNAQKTVSQILKDMSGEMIFIKEKTLKTLFLKNQENG